MTATADMNVKDSKKLEQIHDQIKIYGHFSPMERGTDCFITFLFAYKESIPIEIGDYERFLEVLKEKLETQYNITRQVITKSLSVYTNDTTDAEEWPLLPPFPEDVSDECLEFSNSHGLNDLLRSCLIKAREIFSSIVRLYAEYDYFRDEELEDSGHIVIRVEVSSEQQTALRDYDKWIDWVVENMIAQQRGFFTLTVKRV